MKRTYLLCFLLAVCSHLIAQDSSQAPKKFTINGYLKNLQHISFDKNFKEPVSGNFLHNRLNIKWKPSSFFTVAAEFRNRLFWGENVKRTPGFASLLRNTNEKINLQKVWIRNPSLVLHTNTERLYIDWRNEEMNWRIGRQRINWGISTTFNPNDIFNVYNFLDFDYEERPGIDGAKCHYTLSNSFQAEIAYAHTGRKNGDVAAIKYSLNKWNYDMQLITGWYNEHVTLGAGWAGNIKEAGFKGEAQYFFKNKDSVSHFNLTIEGDYMFKKGWYLNLGLLYNSNGLTNPVGNWNDFSFKLSPENLMPTKWNFILTTAKDITPLFSANISGLYAPGTKLLILLPSLKYNLAANLDVDLVCQSFFAALDKDFQAVNQQFFLRVKWCL